MNDRKAPYPENASYEPRSGASFSRVLRGTLTIGAFVALASGVFVFSNPDLDLFGGDGVKSVRRLLTTKSLVEYAPNPAPIAEDRPAQQDAQPAPKTLATAPDPEESPDFQMAADELGVDPEPDVPAAQPDVPDAPTDPQAPEPDALDEPELDAPLDLNALPDASAKSRAKTSKPRLFALAANLPNIKEPTSKYFAVATNIIQDSAIGSPSYFSGEARRALDARAFERNTLDRQVELLAKSDKSEPRSSEPQPPERADAGSVAQAGFSGAKSEKESVAQAAYETPKPKAPEPQTAAASQAPAPQELTDADREAIESTRADLRKSGVLGAHIEFWGERGFRATGLVRNADGKSVFKEAFGETPSAAGEALSRLCGAVKDAR